ERGGDGGGARVSRRDGEVAARPGARGAAAPAAGLRAMNPMDHDHAVDAELTEALHRLPHRPAPARLVGRVERVLAMAPAPRRLLWRRAWAPALAAALVLLVTAPVVFYQRTAATRVATATMVNEAIADHLRIAQAQRPLEIESGDGHRVRPWFEGRLDFSPVLPFVGDREVPLRGGALAWFLDRRAAAFVYGLRLHTVTLFVFRPDGLPWPSTGWQRAGAHDVYRDSARGFATVLADHGADVIKVENPRGGDPLRTWLRDRGELWWKVYARGKRSITLNLTQPRGQALLKRLVSDADVLLENFVPGTFERWGLGWDALSAANPKLVFARVSGWGQDGPYRDRPGFGTMVEAMSGFAHTTGEAEGPPTLPSFPMADMVAALAGASAVLAALRYRDQVSGRGQVVDISLYEPLLSVLGPDAAGYALGGVVRQRHGNTSDNASPRGTYRTLDDKWIALSASTPASATAVFGALGLADLLRDPRFATNDARVEFNELVDATIARAIGQRTLDEMRGL